MFDVVVSREGSEEFPFIVAFQNNYDDKNWTPFAKFKNSVEAHLYKDMKNALLNYKENS